jgi:ribose 5-phosphate isomerase B
MLIHLASDHAGVELKKVIIEHLARRNIQAFDEGPFDSSSVDYPDFANKVCLAIKKNENRLLQKIPRDPYELPSPNEEEEKKIGILICGSGQGMSMSANKYSFIRAALCYNAEMARLSREHNDANILCLGARFTNEAEALVIVDVFLSTPFSGGRHLLRISKMSSIK